MRSRWVWRPCRSSLELELEPGQRASRSLMRSHLPRASLPQKTNNSNNLSSSSSSSNLQPIMATSQALVRVMEEPATALVMAVTLELARGPAESHLPSSDM